ncbi:hypothetical protein L3Y34_013431 [Caenorhabditis briggsae]|uniref:SET domain-containing protein n=1 Tax=Caenorhabditis briggsae TaxID=6238 RepID=A0AAE8ZYE4_CAEBR|nr:hypothetical protein L3Y34_013430 [Caenorhabditis briggsae]ULT84752.1 hypothetical protein L3Y34_013431 [Caenorhabditis briggsae]
MRSKYEKKWNGKKTRRGADNINEGDEPTISATTSENQAKYVNHSCDPNMKKNGTAKKQGEELTISTKEMSRRYQRPLLKTRRSM